ncbi:DUF2284 domain-containing protein [Novisyntrophococcus fermenticellae]|uniref:DUF2284 domain-containing protein n=1 Tax=Novisyntrophococcus fermenticellae TaxID=2068655 RepID=UPI001E5341F0|nr:DUF2284 domain-containing protein [Novisyntrophococcus fermenticellae]
MIEEWVKAALGLGFEAAAPLDVSTLKMLPEVRNMCAADRCHMYDKNWACPPGCGSLEACEEEVKTYPAGIIVQSRGELEDSFDFEGMKEIEEKHKERFLKLRDELLKSVKRVLPLGSGSCTLCSVCTYPDKPCRMPDRRISSMEAYGLLVSQVCSDNNLPYYYGAGTLTYTSCFLMDI